MDRGFRRTFRLDRNGRGDARSSVREELDHHLELAMDELVEAGWSPAEAQREALRQFGDVEETRAYCESVQARRGREERRRDAISIDELRQDLKYAMRSVRKAPGYAGLVVLTLAFGIAANTTMFSVMNPYLFRPLPFGAAEELVQVNQVNPTTGWDMDRFSLQQYEDWASRTRAFSELGAYVYGSTNVTGPEGPEQIQYSTVTANMFEVLDAQPLLGRTFRPDEGSPGAAPVVVIAYGLWERRYGAEPGTIGRDISLDGVQHTVVGIMPDDFNFPFGGVKLWVPVRVSIAETSRANTAYHLVGRLNDGWTIDRATTELTGIQAELSALYPDTDGRMAGVTVKPLREALNFAWDILSVLFLVLLVAVGFVLLIACANVASLTLARGSGRLREVSVRAALGARRSRIIRQLLTESLLLSLAGGLVGVGASFWLTRVLDPLIPEDLFKIGSISIDRTVLGFSLFVTLLTPLAFGLIPALSASRVDLTAGLKEGSKGSGGLGTSRGRQALVVAQVALAVVLTSGAGLMIRSFAEVQSLELGFDPDRVVTAEIVLPPNDYRDRGERRAFADQVVARVTTLADVESASTVRWLPLNHETVGRQIAPGSLAGAPAEEWPLATLNEVQPGYFDVMGIELVSGRDFAVLDDLEAQTATIVSASVANRLWPGGPAVGQTLLVGDPADPVATVVVGVVDGVQHEDLDPSTAGLQVYRSSLQNDARRFFVVARTRAEPEDVVAAVRASIGDVAPNLPVVIRPMTDVVAENQVQWSLSSVFLGIFGAGALLLATLGIYGLISYSVAQREREMGVRIAMGATVGEIRRRVVTDGVRLAGIGLVVGLAAALGLGQLIGSVLYGVEPFDPITLGIVMTLFLGVAALASFIPAARASRTDPITVLRAE